MAATEAIPPPIALPATPDPASVIAVNDSEHSDSNDKAVSPTQSTPNGQPGQTTRPPYVYTRPQMLYLQKSPMVAPPVNIPPLKDWFGDWHEQQSNNKKDGEGTTHTNGGRERRPRREAEDGGNSQFSQMGNFKHQPIRDREARERERDLRDKDAQDKLRSLSDKYDRDRLSLGSAGGLRGKERELAPHLQGTSLRNGGSTNGAAGRGERREPREAGKRRVGEADDWRRGDRGRDDRKDDRDDREDRERPRSRARNASRAPRDASSRRDRDKSRHRDDRDEDRDRRRGERDDRRRDRDDGPRRAREAERDDDGRHWRDDGRREERQANRRGDRDRGWERGSDPRDRDQDRERWGRGDRARDDDPPSRNRERDKDKDRWEDDRESRPKRGERGGRERRGGAGAGDDPRDKEDRKDKDKDKAPAWMETYVPTGSGGGILGGKGDDGALDELQAWKKTMKERELAAQNANKSPPAADVPVTAKVTDTRPKASEGNTLDEIQQFKLIMKQAQSTPPNEQDSTATSTSGIPPSSSAPPKPATESRVNLSTAPSNTPPGILASSSTSSIDVGSNPSTASIPSSSVVSDATSATSSGSHPLLAMLKSGSTELDAPPTSDALSSYNYAQHENKPAVSRLFPATPATEDSPSYGGSFGGLMNSSAPVSRLAGLARGNGPSGVSNKGFGPGGNTHTPPILDNGLAGGAGRLTPGSQGLQHLPDDFAQLGIGNQERSGLDQLRGQMGMTSPPSQFDGVGRGSSMGAFSPPYEQQRMFGGGSPASQLHDHGSMMGNPPLEQAPQGVGRGSRFAKMFDNDGRRGPPMNGILGANDPGAFSTGGGLRQDMDLGHFGGNDNRADLLAMMNNIPQQMSRGSSGYSGHQNPSPGPQYPGGFANQHALQQQLQQQRLPPASRHDQGLQSMNIGRDERNFHPDLIAPGIRNVATGGRREVYADQFEDPAVFAHQRLPPPGRGIDHIHPGLQQHLPQGGRTHTPMHMQPNMYGRGPSPQQLNNTQRLPTNLTHLGSRPPHDPGQFVGLPGHQQQPLYNNSLSGPGGGGFGGHPQMRGAPQRMLGGQGGIDMRGGQGPMLGGLGPGASGGGMNMGSARGLGGYGMQPSHAVGMQGGNIPVAGRPPQPPFSSQMGGGMMPPQMQQGQNVNVQPDLMSLLIGRRE